MNIAEIKSYDIWTTFFNACGSPSFLHSWEWGELQKKLGHEVLRIGIFEPNDKQLEANDLVLIALVIKMKTKRGSFLFIPHGPIVEQGRDLNKYLPLLTNYLKKLSEKEKFSFLRIAPSIITNEANQKIFNDVGYKKAPIYIHSETMWVLSLEKSENELLSQMRKTTRYLIKKAQKDGVIIETRTDPQASDDFLKIYKHTAEREHFKAYSDTFIQEEFDAFHKTGNAIYLFGKVNNETNNDYLASALLVFTDSTGFYHQGASIHTKVPVPYLLQWEGIKLAKKRGCKFYNFQGILKPGRTPKNWHGLTLFKQGFGGFQLDYVPTQDMRLSTKYYLTNVYERILNMKRGV